MKRLKKQSELDHKYIESFCNWILGNYPTFPNYEDFKLNSNSHVNMPAYRVLGFYFDQLNINIENEISKEDFILKCKSLIKNYSSPRSWSKELSCLDNVLDQTGLREDCDFTLVIYGNVDGVDAEKFYLDNKNQIDNFNEDVEYFINNQKEVIGFCENFEVYSFNDIQINSLPEKIKLEDYI